MASPSYKAEREHRRYSLDVRARLCGDGNEILVRTLDISEGGLGLVSPVELSAGSAFTVRLSFPALQEEFRAEVVVQSRNGFRYGFKFVELDSSSRGLLVKYQRRWGVPAKESYAGSK